MHNKSFIRSGTRDFIICIHDASPAWFRETALIIADLEPLVGRRLSFGVVPDWHGRWALDAHPEYCRLVRGAADELLLHGYHHERKGDSGFASWFVERSDEMNGLSPEETRRLIELGERVFSDSFGERPRGFIAPAWQRGHVRLTDAEPAGIQYIVGFFSAQSNSGRIPLATWTWDCGRWAWVGHVGGTLGRVSHSVGDRVPTLAIHPRDLERGFWPKILRLVERLIDSGHEATTVNRLLAL